MLRGILLGGLLLALLAPSAAAGERAFEIADYYRTAFVGDPSLSPDGRWAVFEVHRYDLAQRESWGEIWRLELQSGLTQQLSFGRHQDSSPSFSPDGRSILFVSDREEGQQLWILAADGGEARRLSDWPLGLDAPVWSPDGRWIAATSELYPECGADPDCNRQTRDVWEEKGLTAHVADTLLYRHWTSWADGKVAHILLLDAARGEVVKDLTPGLFPSPTWSRGGGGYAFSPDSRQLCYVSNHDPDQASSTNADLWVVSVEGEIGESSARNLSAHSQGWDGDPVYSADGRWLAWRRQETPAYEADLFRVVLYDRKEGTERLLTSRESFDDPIESLRFTKDGKALLLQTEQIGRTVFYRLDLQRRKLERLHADGIVTGWEQTPDGRSLVFTRSRMGEPFELWRVPAKGGEAERLSFFNHELEEEVDFRSPEEMWVEVAGGRKVHAWILKPHGFDPAQRYPLIVNVHGGPQGSWNDRYRGDWQVYPGKGYGVLLPNPTGSVGFGQDLTDAIAGDWGGVVYEDVMAVTEAGATLPWVDGDRLGVMGWSYGGTMVMWMEGQTDRFQAAASMMGAYDLRSWYGATEELWFPEADLKGAPWDSEEYERWSASNHVESFATPCLVITGELDYRIPYTQSLQFFTALQKRGVPSRLIVFPDSGHWPGWRDMALYYTAHLEWFHRYLGGGAPPWSVEDFLRGRAFED